MTFWYYLDDVVHTLEVSFSFNLLKVLLEVLQAALQDADLVIVQLLERAVGSTQQADIVCSVSETLCNILIIWLTNVYIPYLVEQQNPFYAPPSIYWYVFVLSMHL